MNVTTEDQKISPLHEHYNRANQYFQAGQYQNALKELDQAKKCVSNENQAAHIDNSIRTVTEMIQQEEPNSEVNEDFQEEKRSGADSNKLLLLTVLVGLICLTPIVMKLIEIFSQPSSPPAAQEIVASAEANPEVIEQNVVSDPAAPSGSPDLIVNSEMSETQAVANAGTVLVSASGVNLRDRPSTMGTTVTTLSLNQSVSKLKMDPIDADGYTWSKVETSAGQSGWVVNKFLQETTPPVATVANSAATPNTITRSIKASGVALRAEPGTGKALVTSLTQTHVTVLEDKAVTVDGFVWTKVRTENDSEGWLADQFLSD